MADTHFRIIFEGKLRNGVELETAKLNLAALFNTNAEKVEQLFSAKPVILKRGLSQEKARQYLSALNQAGVEAWIDTESTSTAPQPEIGEPNLSRVPPKQPTQARSPY